MRVHGVERLPDDLEDCGLLGVEQVVEAADPDLGHRCDPLECDPVDAVLRKEGAGGLEDPLTAARVAALRLRGRDWFRELLLPEALQRLQLAVAGVRRNSGRLAVLDGRMRRRGWGRTVLQALEPWVELTRLRPD